MDKLIKRINQWGTERFPFLLLIDFEMDETLALPLSEVDPNHISYRFNGQTNSQAIIKEPPSLIWEPTFPTKNQYLKAFDRVQKGLSRGDSFLTNLTFPTEIQTNWDLKTVFDQTLAPYKLWWKDRFTVFSPESFVQIKNNRIFSYPMKGTSPTYLPKQLLLDNDKEKAEHATIVDLIRNDLSMVAKKVRVDRYRYLDKIHTNKANLWQTSSQISGLLPNNYHKNLGDIIFKLLPAGSISGAPKRKTLNIIKQAEQQKRGFYTGVAFLWNGYTLDSCVLIRFLEKTAKNKKYWSGGGITAYSNWEEEYKELKEKVYLPIRIKKLHNYNN